MCVLSNKLNFSFIKRSLYEAGLGMRIWNSSGDGQQHKAFIFHSFTLFKKTFQLLLREAWVTWACIWEDLVELHLSVLASNVAKSILLPYKKPKLYKIKPQPTSEIKTQVYWNLFFGGFSFCCFCFVFCLYYFLLLLFHRTVFGLAFLLRIIYPKWFSNRRCSLLTQNVILTYRV